MFSLDLNDNFEGVSLGGNSDDGVANFRDNLYAYAGIYQTTNLGPPRTETSGTARWLGLIQFNEQTRESNFDLTFNSNGGTIKALHANLSDHLDFLIDGDFDANGRISGKVHYSRLFHDAATAVPRSLQRGTLSGIIGQQGAVGAFYGNANFNYAGGFVASPAAVGDGVVTYTDWVRGTATDAVPDVTTLRGQFLRTNGTNIFARGVTRQGSFNRLSLARTTDDGLILGGAASNGVTYFNTSGSNSYAGIYSTTNLGAPLAPNSPGMTWQGVFGIAVGSANYTDDFTLTIAPNATGGTISGTVNVSGLSSIVTITGNFDERGVIYSGFANGRALSGLIGAEGAVGAFIGTNSAGGFVAHKTATHDGVVKYNDWRRETETARAPDTSPARSQFLEMDGGNFISTAGVTIRRQSHRANLGNTGGVLYFLGTNNKGYAGIFSTTDLGAPLPSITGTATWSSTYFGVTNFSNGETHSGSFNLLVTSNGRGGRIRAEEFNIGNALWRISGQFDENGVVSGNINQNHTISGIIGRGGVVVAFISTSSTGVNNAGGFVGSGSFAPAQPRSFFALPANADYTAWRDSFTSAPANLDTANRRNQLLASTSNNGISDE
ncbi:MAG: hypothetical protein K8953_10745, partial [Proteobacteria bacterium]|nr:hypothetical protein [Pseudomonadota bacterium]